MFKISHISLYLNGLSKDRQISNSKQVSLCTKLSKKEKRSFLKMDQSFSKTIKIT
mgnify:CR=1 FL=1